VGAAASLFPKAFSAQCLRRRHRREGGVMGKVRKKKRQPLGLCNPVRIRPIERHADLPSVQPGGWWGALITPTISGPAIALTPERAAQILFKRDDNRRHERDTRDHPEHISAVPSQLEDIAAGRVPTAAEYEHRVRSICADLVGQPNEEARQALRDVVGFPCDYRAVVAGEYPALIEHLECVIREIRQETTHPLLGHNSQLTEAEKRLVFLHLKPKPKKLSTRDPCYRWPWPSPGCNVESRAKKIAGRSNYELVAELETVGQEVLEELAPKFDATRRQSFWSFVHLRVKGAMKNYLSRKRRPSKQYGYDEKTLDYSSKTNVPDPISGSKERASQDWRHDTKSKSDYEPRLSTGAKFSRSYLQSEAVLATWRCIDGTGSYLDDMKEIEIMVIENMRARKSKRVSQEKLAEKWDVSREYVGRLERSYKRRLLWNRYIS
jgi:hypothetical protein